MIIIIVEICCIYKSIENGSVKNSKERAEKYTKNIFYNIKVFENLFEW
jgi:uncharacterized Fe-S cluster-containing radical SAM superfamily enzyme